MENIINYRSEKKLVAYENLMLKNKVKFISYLDKDYPKLLKQINDYLTKCIVCLKNLKDVHIPEDYPVFEKNGQNYIAIKELSEYEATKGLCKEFSLKCLARR